MREIEEMQYVCCPKDGTPLFRTSESVAEIICPKCGNVVVARVKLGKVTAFVKLPQQTQCVAKA